MGKRPARARESVSGEIPVVGMREPCPCGSGRRYKACHGRAARTPDQRVRRPFEGLSSECDWVALREIVPAATAPLRLREDPGREVTLTTVLPLAWPALVRDTGEVFLALQVTTGSGDPSREAADALLRALESEPGAPVPPVARLGEGPRLQDLVADEPLEITVHDSFDYWMAGEADPEVRASLDRANERVWPTQRLASVEAAYRVDTGDKSFLRWVLPHDEDRLLDSFARLHATGEDGLPGVESRFIGSFRADGLVVPVWEIPRDVTATDLEGPAVAYSASLAAALDRTEPLTAAERRARAGLVTRQVTLR